MVNGYSYESLDPVMCTVFPRLRQMQLPSKIHCLGDESLNLSHLMPVLNTTRKNLEGQSASLGDISVNYRLDGIVEGPVVVFLHPLGCDLETWGEVPPACRPIFRTLAYDLRGHGLTKASSEVRSIDDHVEDLFALLDFLNIKQVILAGLSIGGLIALAAGLRNPRRISTLVIAASAARIGTTGKWSERIEAIQLQGLSAVADDISRQWFAPGFAERHAHTAIEYRDRLRTTSESGYLASCTVLRETDLTSEIPRIRIPALVLGGEQDRAVSLAETQALANVLPNAKWLPISGAGHLLPVERPKPSLTPS